MWFPRSCGLAALASAGVLGIVFARRRADRYLGTAPDRLDETAFVGFVPAPPLADLRPPTPLIAAGSVPADRPRGGSTTNEDPVFRPDVEGLRGIAILLVLLFHGSLPIPGGFIGVDVFFVISGFLITGMLIREVGHTGTIALGRFYARRIRRLLPAAAVVLAVTLPLAYIVLAPLDRTQAMDDGISAMLSVSNIRFAMADGDYFAAVTGPSPFLHFWSLSLEEQFYLLWPLLLLLVARGHRPRLRAGVALVVVLLASIAASVVLTDASATWAFYSLPSRAWQFAAGGLLATATGLVARVPAAAMVGAGWVGLGVLVASAFMLDGTVPYPGLLAAAPTVAAVLLIAAGERPWGPGPLLATAPLRFLGRISYSLYLWHWPILVLPVLAFGAALEPAVVLALSAVAIVVAWASERVVERPFRSERSGERRATRRSLAFAIVTMATIVALAGSLDLAAARAISDPGSATDEIAVLDGPAVVGDLGPVAEAAGQDDFDPITSRPTSPTQSPSVTGSASSSSSPAPSLTTAAPARPAGWTLSIPAKAPKRPIPMPREVRPSLAGARSDIERLFADGCITGSSGTRPSDCVYGDRVGSPTIALVGDSHASHWFPVFNVLASRHGWRLLPYVKVACPFVDMPVRNLLLKRVYPECATWRGRVIERLNRQKPDLVIVVSGYRAIIAARSVDASPERQGAAMARAVAQLEMPVAVMIDSPRASFDIPACLSRHRDDVRACAIPRAQAFPDQYGVRERIAAESTGAGLLDLVAQVCPATPCQVVRDGRILYRDGHHLTATFVRSLAGSLDAALAPFLDTGPPAVAASPSPRTTPTPIPVAAEPVAIEPVAIEPNAIEAPARASRAQLLFEAAAGPLVDAGDPARSGAIEPVVATHPSDPAVLAIAYTRATPSASGGGSSLAAGLRISRDRGRTFREAKRHPWDGSGRRPSLHSAIAWGPGPSGAARLYWTGTTTGGGGVRVAIAYSDDLGASWSKLHVVRGTPAWVGGYPDITVDRDPGSPGYGLAYVAYNFPAPLGRGAGIRLLASSDFGRTWRGTDVQRADVDRNFPVSWRFGSRVRTAPDGAVFVSTYQADLRTWDAADVFDRGGSANVGRIGFAVARLTFDREARSFSAGPTVMATTIARNAFTTSRRAAPGTRSHTYLDPMWTHGLDVDRATGRVYLAIAEVAARPSGESARGAVRVGRSDDAGRSWTWLTLPQMPAIDGVRQSSFKPTIAVRGSVVFVGLHTIDDVPSSRAWKADAMIGNAAAVSFDRGLTFTPPALVSAERWRASALERAPNGPGLRDRAETSADARIVWAFGDGRMATQSPSRSAGHRQVFLAAFMMASDGGSASGRWRGR